MLSIKLQRVGRKHQPSYRVVVAERRSKLKGPPVEDLGSYNPLSKANTINKERVEYWLGVGAKPTATVHNLLVSREIIPGPKVKIGVGPKEKEKLPATPVAGAKAEAALETEASVKEKPAELAAEE